MILKSLAFSIAIAAAMTGACSSAQSDSVPRGSEYVALGSSFGSGPGVAERDPQSAPSCQQSNSNYAHLFAAKRGLQLVDRTCGGATTANILTNPQFGLPPQITAVNAQTRLVTITIGGNNLSYIGNLWAESCAGAPETVPDTWKPHICKVRPETAVQAGIESLPQHLHDVVGAVRERAPHATIVLVSYVGVLPAKGACPDRAPLSEQAQQNSSRVAATLLKITAKTAEQEHVKFLDADKLSENHDVCSSDPWVFPFTLPSRPDAFAPVPYHPNLEAMQAIADALNHMLD